MCYREEADRADAGSPAPWPPKDLVSYSLLLLPSPLSWGPRRPSLPGGNGLREVDSSCLLPSKQRSACLLSCPSLQRLPVHLGGRASSSGAHRPFLVGPLLTEGLCSGSSPVCPQLACPILSVRSRARLPPGHFLRSFRHRFLYPRSDPVGSIRATRFIYRRVVMYSGFPGTLTPYVGL